MNTEDTPQTEITIDPSDKPVLTQEFAAMSLSTTNNIDFASYSSLQSDQLHQPLKETLLLLPLHLSMNNSTWHLTPHVQITLSMTEIYFKHMMQAAPFL